MHGVGGSGVEHVVQVEGKRRQKLAPGVHRLELPDGRWARLRVPHQIADEQAHALMVMLHGAGGVPEQSLGLLEGVPEQQGWLVVAPKSRAETWDVIAGRIGPDRQAILRYVEWAKRNYTVDEKHIIIGGFSDGASYALTVGIERGDVFTHIVAFSPGFSGARSHTGEPVIFISHGERDGVLPIDRCSRRLVPALRAAEYDVTYHEFDGAHVVPQGVLAAAVSWLNR